MLAFANPQCNLEANQCSFGTICIHSQPTVRPSAQETIIYPLKELRSYFLHNMKRQWLNLQQVTLMLLAVFLENLILKLGLISSSSRFFFSFGAKVEWTIRALGLI